MIILILTNSKTIKEGPQSSAPLPLSRHPSSLHSAVFPSAFIFLSSTDLDKAIHAFIASHCCVSIPIPASVWSHFEFYSSFRMQQLGFQLNAKQRHHNIPKFCVAFWSRFRYVWKGQKGSVSVLPLFILTKKLPHTRKWGYRSVKVSAAHKFCIKLVLYIHV